MRIIVRIPRAKVQERRILKHYYVFTLRQQTPRFQVRLFSHSAHLKDSRSRLLAAVIGLSRLFFCGFLFKLVRTGSAARVRFEGSLGGQSARSAWPCALIVTWEYMTRCLGHICRPCSWPFHYHLSAMQHL